MLLQRCERKTWPNDRSYRSHCRCGLLVGVISWLGILPVMAQPELVAQNPPPGAVPYSVEQLPDAMIQPAPPGGGNWQLQPPAMDFAPGALPPGVLSPDASVGDDEEVDPNMNRAHQNNVRLLHDVNSEIEIHRRRSKVLVFNRKVVRVAANDPAIADYVLYSERELGILGGAIGSTMVTVWFEDPNKENQVDVDSPLVYLVKVTRDPSEEEISRIDYGRLERKLAVLFPNSKVYLIPFSNKIIVKGQARDSEEASWIMQIIRGEMINQLGFLGGPQGTGNGNGAGNGWDQVMGGGAGGMGYGFGPVNGNGQYNFNDLASFNIINMLTVPGDYQIMMRVRIVELNRSRLRRLGVDFDAMIQNVPRAVAASMGGAGANLSGVFDSGNVNVMVNALKSYGTARILTEPVLTVMSGHTATVLSGGEFAVPTIVGINGVGGQQTVFRGFGVSLLVTPTIVERDLIRMRIRPEYSEINNGNSSGGVPGLNTRRVDTTVQLREGQTIVLAGLLSYRSRTEITGIPFLGGIPWVGPLIFNSKRATDDENELLVMVSPEIVRPMNPDEVPPVPGFEVTVPDDYSLFVKGLPQGPNDTSVYQMAPYGHGSGVGVPIGYGQFNPNPASPMYSPAPGGPGAGGYMPNGGGAYPPPMGYRSGGYSGAAQPNFGRPVSLPNGSGQGYTPPPAGPTATRTNAFTTARSRLGNMWNRGRAPEAAPAAGDYRQAGYSTPGQ